MFKSKNQIKFALNRQVALSGYITDLVWSPSGNFLAASSASGEVGILRTRTEFQSLLDLSDNAIDCLGFCHDGKFLAAAGQDGEVKIWKSSELGEFIVHHRISCQTINPSIWIDRLAWHPSNYLLAFNLGWQVQVWDVEESKIVATLGFEESTVSDLAWSPDGLLLTVGGKNCVKSWDVRDWHQPPAILELGSSSEAIAWSKDSKYMASGNQDNSITLAEGILPPDP